MSLLELLILTLKRHRTGGFLILLAVGLYHQAWALNGPLLVFTCWSAFSFSLVGASYVLGTPRLFGKRANGKLGLPSKLVLLPYVCLTWLTWHIVRASSNEAPFNQVTEALWIGRRLLGSESLPQVEVVLDLTCEFEEPASIRDNCQRYVSFPILDRGIPANTYAVVELLLDPAMRQARVYVHCAQGHGRAGMIAVLLLLAQAPDQSVAATLARVQNVRPGVRLTREQLAFGENAVAWLR